MYACWLFIFAFLCGTQSIQNSCDVNLCKEFYNVRSVNQNQDSELKNLERRVRSLDQPGKQIKLLYWKPYKNFHILQYGCSHKTIIGG